MKCFRAIDTSMAPWLLSFQRINVLRDGPFMLGVAGACHPPRHESLLVLGVVSHSDKNNLSWGFLRSWVPWFSSFVSDPAWANLYGNVTGHDYTRNSFVSVVCRELDTLCDDCAEDGTFRQYVHEASSPRVCDSSGYWTPEEAEGTLVLSLLVRESSGWR